jgi:hypothetical protein
MKGIKIIILLSLIMSGFKAYPQGCNDAGLCSMGDLDGQGLTSKNKYNTQLSYLFGLGEKQTLINTIQFEQRFMFWENRGQIFLQLPIHYIYGNLGQTYGIGDVSLGFNYTYLKKKELSASFMIAVKLPPNDANKTIDDKGAPMVYQTSLGTYDLALGANFFYRKWQLGLGYLKPLGSNKNYFDHAEWPDNSDALEYAQMRDLARGDDGMLRLNRFFYTKKNRYNVGLLALYRLQKDKITQNGERLALENSDGLTLNLNLGYQKVLKNKDAITLSFAAPIITREVRVDGLTRTFIVMFTYAFGSKKKDDIFKAVNFGE